MNNVVRQYVIRDTAAPPKAFSPALESLRGEEASTQWTAAPPNFGNVTVHDFRETQHALDRPP
jgi:hypothetical protein